MKTIDKEDRSFHCPITGDLFQDPYIDHEGNTYERNAILEWLREHGTSPITRNPLRLEQLTPNRALKDLIISSIQVGATTREEQKTQENGTPPKPKVSLQSYVDGEGRALVKICVDDDATPNHFGASVVCVIDVSFSMDDAATMHGDSEGSAGLSLLDVVKHATKTVIESLGPSDQLAIVAYADSAKTVLPFTKMTRANKKAASQAVTSLSTCGSTNLWDGLLQAMELTKREGVQDANIFLLTDGLPNIHPPRGEVPSLIRYKEGNPDMRCRISTFGFGYSLDSTMLNDIAITGEGHYCFIPDSSFVGTVFINAAANVLSTAVPHSILSIELLNGYKLPDDAFEGNQSVTKTSWGISIALPSLVYGQTFEVAFKINKLTSQSDLLRPFQASMKLSGGQRDIVTTIPEIFGRTLAARNVRSELVKFIRQSQVRFNKERNGFSNEAKKALLLAQTSLKAIIESTDRIAKANADDKKLMSIKEDMEGQITESYSRLDWHEKWGRHYSLSLARAHELQQCTNFKDPGLQVYATQKFSILRDQAEEVFCKLPPPKPSLARRGDPNFRPVQNMSRYYNSSTPCFAAGNVRMADGRYIPVSRVAAGDVVLTDTGTAKIVCVVATACNNGTNELVELEGGVLVTPWHPIRPRGTKEWKFPAELGTTQAYSCSLVYSFVLDNGAPFLQIGPFEAVSLGHGIKNDNVARHNYLGTSKVVDDLHLMVGWSEGFIQLGQNPGIRDPESGLIIAFKQNLTTDETVASDHNVTHSLPGINPSSVSVI